MEIKTIRLGNQLGHRRLAQDVPPPRFVRTADDDMPNSVSAGELEQRFHRLFRAEAHGLSAQIPGSLFVLHKIALQGGIDAKSRLLFGLDMNHKPVCVQPSSYRGPLPDNPRPVAS